MLLFEDAFRSQETCWKHTTINELGKALAIAKRENKATVFRHSYKYNKCESN